MYELVHYIADEGTDDLYRNLDYILSSERHRLTVLYRNSFPILKFGLGCRAPNVEAIIFLPLRKKLMKGETPKTKALFFNRLYIGTDSFKEYVERLVYCTNLYISERAPESKFYFPSISAGLTWWEHVVDTPIPNRTNRRGGGSYSYSMAVHFYSTYESYEVTYV